MVYLKITETTTGYRTHWLRALTQSSLKSQLWHLVTMQSWASIQPPPQSVYPSVVGDNSTKFLELL